MAKKKKKPNLNEKQSRAESYNRFVSSINALLAKMGTKVRTGDIEAVKLAKMFEIKYIPPKVVCTDSALAKTKVFKDFEYFVYLILRENELKMDWFEEVITLKQFFSDWSNLYLFVKFVIEKTTVEDERERWLLMSFDNSHEKNSRELLQLVNSYLVSASMIYSDFSKEIVWGEFDLKTRSTYKPSPMFNIIFRLKKAEQKVFLKDRFNRIGTKLYTIARNQEPECISINLKDLGIKRDKVLDVYFQKHVYDRLYERLDAVDIAQINIDLIKCFRKVEYVVTKNNSRLIVFKYSCKILGYFTFRILQEAILCTTFLFLTNDSTPEGEKLKELANLEKADKMYLKIDKLSAFAQSDVRDNPRLVKLFEDAGCGHLFEDEYKPLIREVSFSKIAERMVKYLERDGGIDGDEIWHK